MNDLADRNIDRQVPRTQSRPLARGDASVTEAIVLIVLLSLFSLYLVLQLPLKVLLWSIPAWLLAASYPLTKRFLPVPQAYLSLAYSFGIPMAFVAIQGTAPTLAWVLFMANAFWVLAYDSIYALADAPSDKHLNIHSSALYFKQYTTLFIALCMHAFLGCLVWVGIMHGRGIIYMLGLIPTAALFHSQIRTLSSGHQHLWHTPTGYNSDLAKLRNDQQGQTYLKMFLQHQWAGLIIFLSIALDMGLG